MWHKEFLIGRNGTAGYRASTVAAAVLGAVFRLTLVKATCSNNLFGEFGGFPPAIPQHQTSFQGKLWRSGLHRFAICQSQGFSSGPGRVVLEREVANARVRSNKNF
jgi:hypothetical protein